MSGAGWNDYPNNIRDWHGRVQPPPGWKAPEAPMPAGRDPNVLSA